MHTGFGLDGLTGRCNTSLVGGEQNVGCMLHGNRYTAHCIVSLPIYTLGDVTEVVENLCKLAATLAILDSVSPNPPPTDL